MKTRLNQHTWDGARRDRFLLLGSCLLALMLFFLYKGRRGKKSGFGPPEGQLVDVGVGHQLWC